MNVSKPPERASLAFTIVMLLTLFSACGGTAVALADPRFGDSTWVAPYAEITGSPEDSGPRVAPRDHERAWETILRTPFRVAFFPVRMFARGIEATGPLAERLFPPGDLFHQANPGKGLQFSPELIGLTVADRQFAGPGSRAALTGTWSLSDSRRLKFRSYVGEGVSSVLGGAEALYERKPDRKFYGIGNGAPSDATYFMRRTELASAYAALGRNHQRRARVSLGISDMVPRRGYNGSPRTFDVFDAATVPFLTTGSRLWWYGASADYAALNDSLQPSVGLHFRPEIRRYQDRDGSGIRYDQWRLEARGYAPVFARRRVLALRMVYEGADPRGTAPIPFYRLPETTDSDLFAAYPTGRFRDRRLALGRAEYRWEVERPVSAFLMGELGEVASHASEITLRAAHPSVGGGFRAAIGDQTGRVEITHGHEGLSVRADLGTEW
jgi:hypothetical protein